jgi:hypothetical protein
MYILSVHNLDFSKLCLYDTTAYKILSSHTELYSSVDLLLLQAYMLCNVKEKWEDAN